MNKLLFASNQMTPKGGFFFSFFLFLFICKTECLIIWEFVGIAKYDLDGRKSRILERAIGIKVIRHNKLFLSMPMLFGALASSLCVGV